MNIKQATHSYENWMRSCAPVVEKHLKDKHAMMKHDAFQCFRGTYYRWVQLWPEVCSGCVAAPVVLSVGDLHVDNFGTWRDVEGRLCWGVDDFDEAWPLPYTNDLIRLAASIKIASRMGLLELKTKDACEIMLAGYEQTLKCGGCPMVLAEQETHLEKLGIGALKPPERFWERLNEYPALRSELPRDARHSLERALPDRKLEYRVVQREAGIGSLGQQRFAAIAECRGGFIAREAKRVVACASVWRDGRVAQRQPYCGRAVNSAIRSPDPYQSFWRSWLIRRLSPDPNTIKVEEISGKRDEETLVRAMGSETANVHLGQREQAKKILKDLRGRKPDWLAAAARKMAKIALREWEAYRNSGD